MLLLTGATGLVGSAVLRRLTTRGAQVRCLVRDPRRLGAERVRVQLAIGDLSDPASWRHALRGVKTVVHLAASVGAPLGHNRVADVENAVGVVQTGNEKHSPERERSGYTRRHEVGRQ